MWNQLKSGIFHNYSSGGPLRNSFAACEKSRDGFALHSRIAIDSRYEQTSKTLKIEDFGHKLPKHKNWMSTMRDEEETPNLPR
jgi:hypothetical protein